MSAILKSQLAQNDPLIIDWDADASGPSQVIVQDMVTFELADASVKGIIADHVVSSGVTLQTDPVILIPFVTTLIGAMDNDIQLRLTIRYIAVTELVTKVADEILPLTVPVINIANELHNTSFTLDKAKVSANDSITFHLERLGTDVLDTFTGSIGIQEHSRIEAEVA